MDGTERKAQTQVEGSENDVLLVAAAKSWDMAAFGLLAERHRKKILVRVLRITGNYEDAEDVVQAAFQKAFVHLCGFEERCTFSTWLTKIALNEALMLKRKHQRPREVLNSGTDFAGDCNPAVEVVDARPNPEKICSLQERLGLLITAMNHLKPQLRLALQAYELDELSVSETAQLLGISVNATKSRLNRGRQALRGRLKPYIVRSR